MAAILSFKRHSFDSIKRGQARAQHVGVPTSESIRPSSPSVCGNKSEAGRQMELSVISAYHTSCCFSVFVHHTILFRFVCVSAMLRDTTPPSEYVSGVLSGTKPTPNDPPPPPHDHDDSTATAALLSPSFQPTVMNKRNKALYFTVVRIASAGRCCLFFFLIAI